MMATHFKSLLCVLVCITVTASIPTARADDNAERALELAKQAAIRVEAKDFEGALSLYKRALSFHDVAAYRCNIGASYFELKRWTQAHLYLGMCLSFVGYLRAEYVAEMSRVYAYVEKQLKRGRYAPIEFAIEPQGAVVQVSTWPLDESFSSPRVVWLPPGVYRIRLRAPGYHEQTITLSVTDDRRSSVNVSLEPLTTDMVPPVAEPEPVTASEPSDGAEESSEDAGVSPPDIAPLTLAESKAESKSAPGPISEIERDDASGRGARFGGWISLGVAGAALAGGVAYHVQAAGTRSDIEPLPSSPLRDELIQDLKRQRNLMMGFYGASAIAVGVGVYLWRRSSQRGEPLRSADIGAALDRASAVVWVRF